MGDRVALRELTLDLESVTLGEMYEIEKASGEEFGVLLARPMGRRLMALFLRNWRQSATGAVPNWQTLTALQPLEGLLSTSPSASNGHSETSIPSPSETSNT